ncbi:MAG: hypothetical protein ACLP5E_30010 [Streptosporangiaceae bacterium]
MNVTIRLYHQRDAGDLADVLFGSMREAPAARDQGMHDALPHPAASA